MDDYQMARLAMDAVRTAARLAEQEQRRRQRKRLQENRAGAAKQPPPTDENALRRRPEFDMPVNADGEIPDEFRPHI